MATAATRSILVTGAAGRIGTALFEELQGHYRFLLTDRAESRLGRALADGDTELALDVADFAQCLTACAGIDTVLHLAADPSPEADFDESLLENNIRGTHNIFRAALEAGCRRVIFASSIHAVIGHPADTPIPENATVWPVNMYGVSKCFGEATARKFATDGLSSIAIRIGAYDADWHSPEMGEGLISAWVSKRDLNQLIQRCIEVEGVDFAIVHGQSNNRIKRMSIEATCELTGYSPLDDGYERFQ